MELRSGKGGQDDMDMDMERTVDDDATTKY
jgi:hypothetical protein